MATRNFVPRADGEGGIGTTLKNWATAYIVKVTANQVIVADGAGNYMQLPKLTTGERDALAAVNGMVIYNTTTSTMQAYIGGAWVNPTAGESNTASNVGTAGVGVFKQKTGVDLEFKKISAGSSKVTITDDVANSEVDVDVVVSEILTASSVTATAIAASSITTTKIAASAVTTAKIAPDAITTTKIATSAVDLSSQVVGAMPASRLEFLKIGTPTYNNAQDWMNIIQSASVIDGVHLSTARLSYQLDVTAGSGLIKITDSPIGVTKPFDIGTTENVTLTDNSMNYIYIDYNGGTPIVAATATRSSIEINRHVIIGRCYKDGTGGSAVLTILSSAVHAFNVVRAGHERLVDVYGFQHATGAAVAETGTLNFSVTAGRWYMGNEPVTTDAADTNVADTFIYTHYGAASWIEDNAVATVFDATHYNAGTDALGTLTVNKYGVHWVYILQDSVLYVIYGAGDYSLTEAGEAEPPTSVPSIVGGMGELLAKVIVKQDGTLMSIESVFDLHLTLSGVFVHNEASGLQGGAADEYYHLTNAQADMLTSSGITTTLINTSAVTAAKIAASAVTTAKINATAVTAAKIATSAVTTTKIAISAVTTAKIATSAITTTLINATAVTAAKIATSAVTTTKIAISAVTTAKIAASAITTTLINATAVTAAKVAPNAVTTTKIAASAVTTAKINTSAVTTAKIAASAITTTLINAGAITAAKIASGVLTEKIWFPAESFYLPATNPAEPSEELGSGVYAGQYHVDFDDTTAEHAVVRGPVIDYDGGNMLITMTAKPTTTPGGAVTLIFHIYAVGIADSEAYDSAVTVDTGVDITFNFDTGTLQTDMMKATATIDPTNVADGDKLVLEFIRNVATDTLVGDGELIDFDISWTRA